MLPGVGRSRNRSRPVGYGSTLGATDGLSARAGTGSKLPVAHVRGRSARAFTLIEVLITLGLLVLLAGITWPAMERQIEASEMPESADRVRTMLFMARCEAMMEHRRFRIRFVPEAQHPLIEYEPDPIHHPGEFEPSIADWAEEPVLLSDVQVHSVRLGRPAFLRPLIKGDDPDLILDKIKDEEETREEREDEGFGRLGTTDEKAQTEEDENRPIIIFEPDGSTDWALVVLSRVPLEDELDEEDEQIWVLLDGRTGLAKVQEQVTEEQLADPEFYIEWDKLELPDTVNVGDLTFQIGNPIEQGTSGSSNPLDELLSGMGDDSRGQGGTEELSGAGEGEGSGFSEEVGSVEDQLEVEMADSDLTEEEMKKIRGAFQGGHNGGDGKARGGGGRRGGGEEGKRGVRG